MSFLHFFYILRARWMIVFSVLALTLSTTVIVSLLMPKQYTAATTLVIDFKGTDPVLGIMLPSQLMPGYMATQVDIIQSKKVATDVVRRLGVAKNEVIVQQWKEATEGRGNVEDYFADVLLKKLEVTPSRESSVITISFSGRDPRFAAAVANGFAEEYQRTNLALRVEPARQSAAFFDDQLGNLRKSLEDAQTRLADYQRDRGFTAADERMDLETARLQELSAQYALAQGNNADAQSRLRQLNDFIARGASPEALPDVLANSLVQNLKNQLSQTEARLQQVASQLGSNHPEVKRLEADIESQRSKLKAETNVAASSIRNAAAIAQRREFDLRDQLSAQKGKLLRANQGRDQLMVLVKEVDNAQKAFDVASQRFQTTKLESQTSQTNISVLTPALPPVEHSSPKLVLNIVLAVFLGSLLGVAVALLVELVHRRIRSPQDFFEGVGAPILGIMLDDRPGRNSKGRFFRNAQFRVAAVRRKTQLIQGS